MIVIYNRAPSGTGLVRATGQAIAPETLWIDLVDPAPGEDGALETALGIDIPTRAEMREIESSSRLYAENGTLYMTAFIIDDIDAPLPSSSTATFILTGGRLVTVRYASPKAFQMVAARAEKAILPCADGGEILAALLEALVSQSADLIERMQDDVEKLTAQLFHVKGGEQTRTRRLDVVLRQTGKAGDMVATVTETATSLDRLLNFLRESQRRSGADDRHGLRLGAIVRDVASLNEHLKFLSDRTTFLLNATLGMITIEQNQIIKLFSVMAVMLMPPTLVASIYGMNFRHMPELDWAWGYPGALLLMLLAALVPFVYFRRKGWM